MSYNKKYTLLPTSTFKRELGEIIYYIKYKLKEPSIAKSLYNNVIKEIQSLEFMPERYKRIENVYDKSKILRKLSVNNYIIIYEVNDITRTSLYFTHFSWQSRLYK